MSWKSTREKEKFFEDLDKAFNTPATNELVVPRVQSEDEFVDGIETTTTKTGSQKRRPSDTRGRESKRRATDPSETKNSTGVGVHIDVEKPKQQKPSLKNKSPPQSRKSDKDNTESKKPGLLDGIVCYFIPNSKANGVRRYRMTLFAKHGADVRHEWNDQVTHILCDNNITGERILENLRWEQFPVNVTIVNENWVPECLATGRICDVLNKRFQVPGVQSQTTNDSNSPEVVANGSLQVKPVPPKRRAPNTQSTEHGEDDSIDLQDYLFRKSSPPNPTITEREALDQKSISLSTSPILESTLQNKPLDDAINEILNLGPTTSFIDEINLNPPNSNDETEIPAWQQTFSCMHAHSGTENKDNPNSQTIKVLGEMQAYYERTNDEWRAMSYRKVISTLKKTKEYICTEEQAKSIPGIGDRLAKKIAEIVTTGELQRLRNLDSSDYVVEKFMGIYGVGKTIALKWMMQGLRTLDDVLERGEVTECQRIGIELYNDFAQRIPREEVAQHSRVVKDVAAQIDNTLEVFTMGSYRRGAKTCGDIDLIITKPDATAQDLMRLMTPLVDTLTSSKFLTHSLATSHSDDGSKWHGVSRLPNGIHRRLDLLFVPWQERGAALIYFTGNDVFNRSLRLLASKKGMGLNQRGLFKDTLRGPGRIKITRGTCIASESEGEIFGILGVPWRPPELRNC